MIRAIAALLCILPIVALLLVVHPPGDGPDDGRTELRIWHPWGGPLLEPWVDAVALYERAHPDTRTRPLFTPGDLANSQKFFTAVIGHCAPEVIFVDGPQVPEWAERGLLTPLDGLLREAGVDPERLAGEFFAPCWKQCVYHGQVYALTYCADPNFAFSWNRGLLRRLVADGEVPPGTIDPERPPETLADLDRLNAACTRLADVGGDQRGARIGLIPWGIYGNANSLFTWGWAFGGEFYDDVRQRVTADDPKVVAALEWMAGYARTYGYARIGTVQESFGMAEHNPFVVGRQALQVLHISGLANVQRYAPQMDFGLGFLPQPPGGERHSAWLGGWTLAIPSGTDPARRAAALRFMLWACASQEGTSMAVRTARLFPGWKPSAYWAEAGKDPHLAVYVRILAECRHQRPVMPVQSFYVRELHRAVDRVLREERHADGTPVTAAEALAEATARTQQQLDHVTHRARAEGAP